MARIVECVQFVGYPFTMEIGDYYHMEMGTAGQVCSGLFLTVQISSQYRK